MTEINSFKGLMEYESLITKLKIYSLLKNDEPIIGGFYPIRVKGSVRSNYSSIYNCLLTTQRIILATKNKNMIINDYNFELIPFENIKTTSLERYRDKNNLLGGIVTLIAGITCALVFTLIIESLEGLADYLIFVMVSLMAVIVSIIIFYKFFRGEDVIILKGPEKDLILQGSYIFWKMQEIIFWRKFENGRNLQLYIKNIPHLYRTLKKYTFTKS